MRQYSLLLSLSLAACAAAPPEQATVDQAPAVTPGTCRNDALASFTGQPQSEELAKRILSASGARTIRWVEKDMMVTMEFREDRVTVHLDAAKRVERAVCG